MRFLWNKTCHTDLEWNANLNYYGWNYCLIWNYNNVLFVLWTYEYCVYCVGSFKFVKLTTIIKILKWSIKPSWTQVIDYHVCETLSCTQWKHSCIITVLNLCIIYACTLFHWMIFSTLMCHCFHVSAQIPT